MKMVFMVVGFIISGVCHAVEPRVKVQSTTIFMHIRKYYVLSSLAQALSVCALVEDGESLS